MALPHQQFLCQLVKKCGGGPKVQKKKQNRGTIMFDFKIGGLKSLILQNRGTKSAIKPKKKK
jgi:uncharacterized membrane protein YebE (DUF533 family)